MHVFYLQVQKSDRLGVFCEDENLMFFEGHLFWRLKVHELDNFYITSSPPQDSKLSPFNLPQCGITLQCTFPLWSQWNSVKYYYQLMICILFPLCKYFSQKMGLFFICSSINFPKAGLHHCSQWITLTYQSFLDPSRTYFGVFEVLP